MNELSVWDRLVSENHESIVSHSRDPFAGMTPVEIWTAIRGVKIAGPWQEIDGEYIRHNAAGGTLVKVKRGWFWHYEFFLSGRCSSADEAKGFADRYLRNEAWILV